MRLLLAVFAAALPIPHNALLAIDRHMTGRNFLPTRMLPGFTYRSWSYTGGVLYVDFRNKAGEVVEWDVAPLHSTPSCAKGSQRSFQLDGNKVWWAQRPEVQLAWRCVFGQDGVPLLIAASTATPPSKLAPTGLGIVAASAKRY